MSVDLKPKTCPQCGREAWFSYSNVDEARRQSPLCWAECEEMCPGFVKWSALMGQSAVTKEQR